jgi:hypothetical protein
VKKTVTLFIITASILLSSIVKPVFADNTLDQKKAFLLSLVIPGLGQYYAGSQGYAKLFFSTELAVWGMYYYNTTMKQSTRDNYYVFAALHAGAHFSGQTESYIGSVGAYASSFEYNIRQLTRESPTQYTGTMVWEWDNETNRSQFKKLRERELDYENNMKYCVAGLVCNHLISAFHASKIVRQPNNSSSLRVIPLHEGLSALYTRSY